MKIPLSSLAVCLFGIASIVWAIASLRAENSTLTIAACVTAALCFVAAVRIYRKAKSARRSS